MKKITDKSRVYTNIAMIAAFAQMYVPQLQSDWHLSDVVTKIITVVLLTVVSVVTIKKQRVSIEINDKNALLLTYVLIGMAIAGGLNEILSIAPLN